MSQVWLYNHTIDSEKENILFLHGFLENSTTWDPFLKIISNQYNCFLYDFPGHGKNTLSYDISFTEISKQIIEGLNKLNLKRIHVISHSMGGYFACYLKDEFPNYFHKIILANSTFKSDTQLQKKNRTRTIKILQSNFKKLCSVSFNQYDKVHQTNKVNQCWSNNPEQLIKLQNILMYRQDFSHVYLKYDDDFFFVFGELDNQIPWKEIKQITKKRQHIFHNLGHMLPSHLYVNEWSALILEHLK